MKKSKISGKKKGKNSLGQEHSDKLGDNIKVHSTGALYYHRTNWGTFEHTDLNGWLSTYFGNDYIPLAGLMFLGDKSEKGFFFGRDYVVICMPSNGWNCWLHAFMILVYGSAYDFNAIYRKEFDFEAFMAKYYPYTKPEWGKGLDAIFSPYYIKPTTRGRDLIQAFDNAGYGYIGYDGHAWLKLSMYVDMDEQCATLYKSLIDWHECISECPDFFTAEDYYNMTLVESNYAAKWAQANFIEVQAQPMYEREVAPLPDLTQPPQIVRNPTIMQDLPHVRLCGDGYVFYPSNNGQCVWECLIYYHLWQFMDWSDDFTQFLDFVVVKRNVQHRFLKRLDASKVYLEVQVTPQILNDYQTVLARLVPLIQSKYQITSPTVRCIAEPLSKQGLRIVSYREMQDRPFCYMSIYYLHLGGLTDQQVHSGGFNTHASLFIPKYTYANNAAGGIAVVRYNEPDSYGSMPLHYCARDALGEYASAYEDTMRVRRWFDGEVDYYTSSYDMFAHLQTKKKFMVVMYSKVGGTTILTYASTIYSDAQTPKMVYLYFENNHWQAKDLDHLRSLMDPKLVHAPKPKEVIDGYEVSTTKSVTKEYTVKPISHYCTLHQNYLDIFAKKPGFVRYDVPRKLASLPLNGYEHGCILEVDPKALEIRLHLLEIVEVHKMTDFPYRMLEGPSTEYGYVRHMESIHLGSGVYLARYEIVPPCTQKMQLRSSSNMYTRGVSSIDGRSTHNSQMSVAYLSILSDTDRRKGILTNDVTAIDQATNFCYAVTSSKDPNYNDAEVINMLRGMAKEREQMIHGHVKPDKYSKHRANLVSAWSKRDLFAKFEHNRKSTKHLLLPWLSYQFLDKCFYGFLAGCAVTWSLRTLYLKDIFVPKHWLQHHSILVPVNPFHPDNITALVQYGRRDFKKKVVSNVWKATYCAVGFALTALSLATAKIFSYGLDKLGWHPTLLLNNYTRSIQKNVGCGVCKGRTVTCIHCDYTDRDFSVDLSRPAKILAVAAGTYSAAWMCYAEAWSATIKGATYEPSHQAMNRFNRFPVPMDNSLTVDMMQPSYLNNYKSYDTPGYDTPSELVAHIRSMPVKVEPMKNSTSLIPIFQDLRMNCIQADIKSALTALFNRQGHYDVTPAKGYLESIGFMEINEPELISAAFTTPLVSAEEFIEQSEPRKRKIYRAGIDMFYRDCKLDNTYTVFPKGFEMAYKTKRGRIICGPSKRSKGVTAWVNHNLIRIHKQYWRNLLDHDPLFSDIPYDRKQLPFIHGLSTSDIRGVLEKCFRTFKNLRLVTLDIKGFDGSQNAEMLGLDQAYHRLVFCILAARMGFSPHHTQCLLEQATKLQATLKLYDRDPKAHYKILKQTDKVLLAVFTAYQSVFSGNPYLTTLGNTGRQLKIIYALLKKHGLSGKAFAFASGDDMCIAMEDEVYEEFRAALATAYAPDGTTGPYGAGMILKEIMTSHTSVKFLSKNLEVFGSGVDCVVEFYRDITRFVQTGGSGKPLDIDNSMINYMNTCQLESQCYGDQAMLDHIAYRKRTMPHHIPTRRAWNIFFNDSDYSIKNGIHITTETRDLSRCLVRDPAYGLLKAHARTHEVLIHTEGPVRLAPSVRPV